MSGYRAPTKCWIEVQAEDGRVKVSQEVASLTDGQRRALKQANKALVAFIAAIPKSPTPERDHA